MKLHRQVTKLKSKFTLNLFSLIGLNCRPVGLWGAGIEQWWQRSPPTSVSGVRWSDPASYMYVGWVCCCFSTLLLEVLLWVFRFSPLLKKTNISKFQFDPGMHGHFRTSCCELLGAPWVNKLHFTCTNFSKPLFSPYVLSKKRSSPRFFIRISNTINSPSNQIKKLIIMSC